MMLRAGFAIAIITACDGGSTPKLDAGNDGRQTVVEVPATPNRDLDILFMIDNSGSMADKQANLAANFPNFIAKLNTAADGLPSLHLGIITPDMGTKGSANPTPGPGVGQIGQGGCASTGDNGELQTNGAPITGNFITDIRLTDGTRQKNYTGELATVFGQMARLGANGCGFEQPLHAIKTALDNNPANAGFLRPNALLAVLMLTDEDDCTIKDPAFLQTSEATLGPLQSFRCTRFGVTCGQGGENPDAMNQLGTKGDCTANTASSFIDDVAAYRDFLVGLKSDPKKVVAGAIMGVPDPVVVELRTINGTSQNALAHSCTFNGTNGTEVADPGVRIKSFLDLFPDRSTFSTICQQDLSGGLDLIADLVANSIGSPCISDALADIDPNAPGLQVDCLVEDVIGVNATQIVPCNENETPTCWKLETDPVNCSGPQNLKLVVVRSGPPDPETVTRMRCFID